jgi:hypothetical protein
MSDPDERRAQRAMKAMLGMKKIDVAGLLAAADRPSHEVLTPRHPIGADSGLTYSDIDI